MDFFGYFGKILVVNLSTKECKEVPIPEDVYRKFLGGYGLGAYYIYNNMEPNCDPMGPKNILGFCPGLLTGSPAPLTGRYVVCAKSPLTGKGIRSNGNVSSGGWGNANSGGTFGPVIKKTGFDAIFFEGKADNPVYLLIDKKNIEIREANFLWGKDIIETEKKLKELHGSQFNIAAIGKAGENLSLIAGIVNDKGRIAARSGMGAVMGSKNLKALCLYGTEKIKYYNKEILLSNTKEYLKMIKKNSKKGLITKMIPVLDRFVPLMRIMGMGMGLDSPLMPKILTQMFGPSGLGTTSANVLSSQIGDTPIKNLKGVGFKDFPYKNAMNIRGKALRKHMKKKYGCFSCPIQCGAILEYEDLPYEEKTTHRPEYETSAAFGSLILNDNLDVIIKVNEYLNREGMDSISAGMTVAFVLECCENGILNKGDFKCEEYPDGFLPKWGESDYILPLVKLMVSREGIGDKLADGTKIAAEKISNSKQFAMNVNGQEIPMHDARMDPNLGLTYITDPTPARHTAASLNFEMGISGKYFMPEVKFIFPDAPYQQGLAQAIVAKFHQIIEGLGFCLFAVYFGKYPLLEILNALTGWDVDIDELFSIGHRIQTLRQMFNAREGAIRHEIPDRAVGNPPLSKGPLKGVKIVLEPLIAGYYNGMGFLNNGVPSEEILNKLGLDFCLKDLKEATGDSSYINRSLESIDEDYNPNPKIVPLKGG